MYNFAVEIDIYRETGLLDQRGWLFPPPCLKERAFDFIIEWSILMKCGGPKSFFHGPVLAEFHEYSGFNVPKNLLIERGKH